MPLGNKFYLLSVLFFAVGFLSSLILIIALLTPFNIHRGRTGENLSSEKIESLYQSLLKAREEVKEVNKELKKQLSSRTHQLEKTRSELFSTQIELLRKEKLASLAQMASGVVHEIKNPLAIMRNSIYILQQMRQDGSLSKVSEYSQLDEQIKILENEVERMDKMAQRLFQLGRTQNELALHEVNINQLLDEALEDAKIQPNYSKVKVNKNISPALPPALGEEEYLREVFSNIINNAYQAMPEGGNLQVGAEVIDHKMHIRFSDTGKGIFREEQKFIFEPFFTTKGKRGAGLGMAISYAIIERMQGEIKLKSEEGKGTTFTVILQCEQ